MGQRFTNCTNSAIESSRVNSKRQAFADTATTSTPRSNRGKAKSLLRFEEIGSKMQTLDQIAARKSDANIKELKKKAPKSALCFQNRPEGAHKACTPENTWSGSHARRVRFRDLETNRNSNRLRDHHSRSFGLIAQTITGKLHRHMWPRGSRQPFTSHWATPRGHGRVRTVTCPSHTTAHCSAWHNEQSAHDFGLNGQGPLAAVTLSKSREKRLFRL